MGTYSWRALNGGAFDLATDWIDTTPGQSRNPAATPPGPGDTANLDANGGTVTGTGNVANLNFAAAPSWIVAGQLSAINISVNDSTDITSGGVLTLAGGLAVIGNGDNATGALTVDAGGEFTSTVAPQSTRYVLQVGGMASDTGAVGTLTVQGQGALVDTNGNPAAVGLGGAGTLNVAQDGALAKFGTTDPVNGLPALAVGLAGQGTVNVTGIPFAVHYVKLGTVVRLTGTMDVGRGASGRGVVNLSASASLFEASVNSAAENSIGSGGLIDGVFVTGGNGQLHLSGNSNAVFADSLGAGGNGGTGAITVSGASGFQVGGVLEVGYGTAAPGGNGTLTINTGSQVSDTAAPDTTRAYLSVAGSSGTTGAVTVDGGGAFLGLGANAIADGNGGTGSITVSNGGVLVSGSANSLQLSAFGAGDNTGSHGTLAVTGAGSVVTAGGDVYFGRAGSGTLIVSQGGSFTGGAAATGASPSFGITIGGATQASGNAPLNFGGSGTAQVTGASMLHSLGGLLVGYDGTTGTLLVDTGSTAQADGVVIAGSGADRPGGAGTITVQGASTLASGGQHTLGTAGITIGSDAGTGGTINVAGAGSTLSTKGDRITVGQAGAAFLTVAGGAKALAGAAYADSEAALAVGALAGGVGTVTIEGAFSQLIASGQAALGGANSGAGTIAGGMGTVSVTGGGSLQTGTMNVFAGSALNVDAASRAVVQGDLADAGSVTASGAFQVSGNAEGGGTLNLGGGVTDLGGLGALTVDMSGAQTVLRVHGLTGASTISGMQFGEAIDLAGITGATLSGNTVTASLGSIALGAAPAGYVYKLYDDASGGTDILLDPTSPPADAISLTDTTSGTSDTATGDEYTGPVGYLQRQYVWAGTPTDNLAIRANVPNAFLKGGAGNDALQADYGNNVLDGGAGSNFLIGGTGADGGRDTFYVDARNPGQVTWSTIVNFHPGDQATIFGFHPNVSTMPFTAFDGVPGYTGATIHSEINGPGTGVDASITFAGIDVATAQYFTYSTGTLPGGIDYLLIQYT